MVVGHGGPQDSCESQLGRLSVTEGQRAKQEDAAERDVGRPPIGVFLSQALTEAPGHLIRAGRLARPAFACYNIPFHQKARQCVHLYSETRANWAVIS